MRILDVVKQAYKRAAKGGEREAFFDIWRSLDPTVQAGLAPELLLVAWMSLSREFEAGIRRTACRGVVEPGHCTRSKEGMVAGEAAALGFLDEIRVWRKPIGDCVRGDLVRAVRALRDGAHGMRQRAQFYQELVRRLPQDKRTVREVLDESLVRSLFRTICGGAASPEMPELQGGAQ